MLGNYQGNEGYFTRGFSVLVTIDPQFVRAYRLEKDLYWQMAWLGLLRRKKKCGLSKLASYSTVLSPVAGMK